MVSIDMLRRLLDAADVRQDPYAVAAIGAGLLDVNRQDAHALQHYIRALAALELGAAARRVLAGAGLADDAAAREWRQSLERLPAGVVPWSSRHRRFQANLRALEHHGISGDALLAAWDDPQQGNAVRYELHQAADGNFHIFDLQQETAVPAAGQAAPSAAAPWRCWLGGFDNFRNVTASIPEQSFKGQLRGPLAFDGIGHGWLIPHVLEMSEQSYLNYSLPIYIIEPDLVAFCMALHTQDLQRWLSGPRLRLFLGGDAPRQFVQALRDHAGWTLPAAFSAQPLRPRPSLNLQAEVESLHDQRARERQSALQRIDAYYRQIDGAGWRKRFAEAQNGGPSLRVLGITTRFSTVLQYSMQELQAASETCGIPMQMEVCIEPDDQSLEKDYVGMIDRMKPDLLITISRMRYEMPDLPRNVPALCWDQDNLQCMRDPGALADMQGLTFVAGYGAVFGSMHLDWPLSACIFCHPAGRTHHYQPSPAGPEETRQFGADVSYVSHASGTPEQLRDQMRQKWQGGAADFLPLYDASAAEIIASCRGGQSWHFLKLQSLIRRAGAEARLPVPPAVENALLADLPLLVDRVFRHETLAWVARWCETRNKRLRLWGNGWDKNAEFAKWAAGCAVPGEQAQAVFRASRINLQIIETGILHSRLLDGWAAGGFFLIRQAHRIEDEARIRNCFRIGTLAANEGIDTIGQLEARASDQLREAWQAIAAEYVTFDRNRAFPGFVMWKALIPAHLLIPQLEHIMFKDAAEFEAMADRFSGSEADRAGDSGAIHAALQQHLSYDARWREFIGHIATHVGYECPANQRSAETK